MHIEKLALRHHIPLLCLFVAVIVCLWMLPIVLAGFPYVLSGNAMEAKAFMAMGRIHSLSPMTVLLFSFFSPLVGWENSVGWSLVSAVTLALALLPFWWSVTKLFSERIAWLTIIAFAFMPVHWIQAVRGGGYAFAFFFLFLGFAVYLHLRKLHPQKALYIAALFFGFVLASHHAFITFLPWICGAYFWHSRRQWRRALLHLALFCSIAYVGLQVPLVPNALGEMTIQERVEVFLPAVADHTTGVGHLYPDYYAYEFLREDFEKIILERNANAHFLTRQQDKYVHWIFGVGDLTAGDGIENGVWLFLHTLPELLVQEYLGGAFLWIFILLGGLHLYRNSRTLFFHIVSLWLCMEFILRFILHYGRTHLMDIGWGFALFTGIGITVACDAISKQQKISTNILCILVAVLVSFQLIQSNRKVFAHHYSRTTVPETYAATEALNELPEDSIVSHPRKAHLFYFTETSNVVIHTETVDYLQEQNRLSEPFLHYGVTHIIGYNEEHVTAIRSILPHIQVVTPKQGAFAVPITPVTRYILHLVR